MSVISSSVINFAIALNEFCKKYTKLTQAIRFYKPRAPAPYESDLRMKKTWSDIEILIPIPFRIYGYPIPIHTVNKDSLFSIKTLVEPYPKKRRRR